MAVLTDAQLKNLTSWPTSRDGEYVPGTDQQGEAVYQNACWSWALTGGTGLVNSPTSGNKMYEDIVAKNPFVVGAQCVTGVNCEAARRAGGERWWINVLEKTWENAKAGKLKDQKAFKMAMLMMIAKANGLWPFWQTI